MSLNIKVTFLTTDWPFWLYITFSLTRNDMRYMQKLTPLKIRNLAKRFLFFNRGEKVLS